MKERNYGIDLLKIVSMFMIVVLHIHGNGGVIGSVDSLTLNGNIVWFIEILCYPSVNLFALATGYLCIDKKIKFKNIINLWFLVVFYNILLTFICNGVSWINFWDHLFPVLNTEYWYFTAYFTFMLFAPYLNEYLNSIDKDKYKRIVILLLISFSGIGFLSNIMGRDVLKVDNGFSAIWLMSLYIIGGYVKLHNFKFKKYGKFKCFSIYIIISLFLLFSRYIIKSNPEFFSFYKPDVFDSGAMLIKYNSIFIFVSSFFLFLFFLKIRVNYLYKNFLEFFSGLSFSVYIIHFHNVLKLYYLNGCFRHLSNMKPLKMIYMILFSALIIYSLCTVIDIIRYYLFKFLRVEKLSEKIDKKIVCLLTKKG